MGAEVTLSLFIVSFFLCGKGTVPWDCAWIFVSWTGEQYLTDIHSIGYKQPLRILVGTSGILFWTKEKPTIRDLSTLNVNTWLHLEHRGACTSRWESHLDSGMPQENFKDLWRTVRKDVESKSQPVELDNSTTELHVPSRRKESLQSYCSVDFDFLAFWRFDMTFDAPLRDESSFGKFV